MFDEISDKFENSHVGSKTRLLGQSLEKLCERSRGHIFSPIIMKLGQNVFLDEAFGFKNGSCSLELKARSLGQIEKPSVPSRFHIFSPIIMKLG